MGDGGSGGGEPPRCTRKGEEISGRGTALQTVWRGVGARLPHPPPPAGIASELRMAGQGSYGRLVGRSAEGAKADVAQLAERVLGKDEVTGSIPVIGSSKSRQLTKTTRATTSNGDGEQWPRRS